MRSARPLAVVVVALSVALASADGGLPDARAQTVDRPNVVLVLTDDQGFDTLEVMPNVRALADRGMTLRRAIVTNPLCCPSRATILTGRFAHTTGVYANVGTNGGWSAFRPSEGDTIATALDEAGYRTALIGKYLNDYVGDDVYVPPGWDRWAAFADFDGAYYDYEMLDSLEGIVTHGSRPSDYSTDVIRRLSTRFVRNTPADTPLFLLAAPYAPHGPATAAPRDEGAFASAPVAFNPAVNESRTLPISRRTSGLAARGRSSRCRGGRATGGRACSPSTRSSVGSWRSSPTRAGSTTRCSSSRRTTASRTTNIAGSGRTSPTKSRSGSRW